MPNTNISMVDTPHHTTNGSHRDASNSITVVVVGLGQMGNSHALSYHHNPDFNIIGLVNRSPSPDLPPSLKSYPFFSSLDEALLHGNPDLISIATHISSHYSLAVTALIQAKSHVFIEKPLASTVEEAEHLIALARDSSRKLIVGYILRHHPSWQRFISLAREELGGPPYVFRMNLNQQSTDRAWEIHKKILETASPVIDCGVHYIDVMLQITDARPTQVRGMGVKLARDIPQGSVNYGHLQVVFENGSVGWYEAGWGPMMSTTAHFVKDVVGPRGAVSIVGEEGGNSADVEGHTRTSRIRLHRTDGNREAADEVIEMENEPGHQQLCDLEQAYVLKAIRENLDLEKHWADAVRSQAVVLAADESMREGRAVDL